MTLSPAWQLAALAVGAVLLLATIALLWRRRPWRGARPRYPVILAHGLLGFSQIGAGPLRQDYFRGVVAHLRALGVTVVAPSVPAAGSIADRARALAQAIQKVKSPRVNIIAHSMGGLDARFAIHTLRLGGRVASLTTLGTPHRGTPVADLGAPLRGLFRTSGLDALAELTTRHLETFNREHPLPRRVRCGCVLASVPPTGAVNPLLAVTHRYLNRRGANDGLVPIDSQRFGKVLGKVETDHWGLIGWSPGFDAPAFYERLMRQLRKRGC